MSSVDDIAGDFASGKGRGDENFPVASWLIAGRHRPVVWAFYRVARLADDIADHVSASRSEKLAAMAEIEGCLTGVKTSVRPACDLRHALADRDLSDRHILDLLVAFRRDVVKPRTADWGDLMDYCRYSAAPVGRFMLEVHGEDRACWPASDALCAALQVINHLQDCGEDYRTLDRIYVPADALNAAGLTEAALGETSASPALKSVISDLTVRTGQLLAAAAPLASRVRDPRLALEIGVIHSLAVSLNRRLAREDPLAGKVRHAPIETLGLALGGAAAAVMRMAGRRSRGPEAIQASPAQ